MCLIAPSPILDFSRLRVSDRAAISFGHAPESPLVGLKLARPVLDREIVQLPELLGQGLLVAREQHRVVGRLVAGSLGVRGLIHSLQMTHQAFESAAFMALVNQGLGQLRRIGIGRAHLILSEQQSGYLAPRLTELGFHPCPGEPLYMLDTAKLPKSWQRKAPSVEIKPLCRLHVAETCKLLASCEQVAFQEWEQRLIDLSPVGAAQVNLVAISNGQIVGAAIGGSFAGQGTITHQYTHPDFRGHGIGHDLTRASLEKYAQNGVSHVHLMTVAGNEAAQRYWQRIGFSLEHSLTFLEIDLPDGTAV